MNKKQAWLELCVKHGAYLCLSGEEARLALNCYCLGKGIINSIQPDDKLFTIDDLCFFCKKPINSIEDAETGTGYWSLNKHWIKYHKTCRSLKKEYEKAQQEIDCNCNDCSFFRRSGKKTGSKKGGYDFHGYCIKLKKQTVGQSVPLIRLENQDCFRHRDS
jgi:hypothetical protein